MRNANKRGIHKLNSKGMSLIEVLVAVIIMSVVSIVFLRSFVFSNNLNRDAQVRQDALIIGQSLMEGAKAYDLKSLDTQFSVGGTIELINLGGTKSYTYDATDDTRTYKLEDVPIEGNKYDATMVIKPHGATDYSDKKMATIEDYNKFNDAFFKQNPLEQDGMASAVLSALHTEGYTGSSISSGTVEIEKRELNVTIEKDASDNDVVTVNSKYYFKASGFSNAPAGGALPSPGPTPAPIEATGTYEVTQYDVYTNGGTKSNGAKLQNVYLFYYPAYMSAPSGFYDCSKDIINITNSLDTVQNVYLIKQRYPVVDEAYITAGEGNYDDVEVNVTSCDLLPNADGSDDKLNVYSNTDVSLTGSGTQTTAYTLTNCSATSPKVPWAEDDTEKDLLYTVEIKVTRADETDVMCELNGTTNVKREQE